MDACMQAISLLSPRLAAAVERASKRARISEIRLRASLPLSLTVSGENCLVDESGRTCGLRHALRASAEEVSFTVFALCEGSVYRHVETLSRGYLVTDWGVRAGFSGKMLRDRDGKSHVSLSDFSGVNLRIPYAVSGVGARLLEFYRAHGLCSTLVYSAPGVGKTTLLRDLALSLSGGALGRLCRVCVLDERGELFPKRSGFQTEGGLLDVLTGQRKAEGIELATRLLSPEVILCDELGAGDGAEALLDAQNNGVYFIASVHASTVEELLKKPQIASLLCARVFSCLCRLEWDAKAGTSRLFPERLA